MKHSKKLFAMLLSVMMIVTMIPSTAFAAEGAVKNTEDIVVLFTNDTHCTIDQPSESCVGFAGVAGLRDAYEKEYQNVALVDAGDEIQGNLAGALSKGSYMVDIFNAVEYDYAVPGNHEFDFTLKHFLFEIVPTAKVEYLSANFKHSNTGTTIFRPYAIRKYGDTKVAFVGISTPETFTKSTPAYFQDENGNYLYNFCQGNNGQDLYNAVQTAVNQARAKGADYVIAIGHLGIDSESAPWRSTDVASNTYGIDAFIDGHSHSEFNGSPTEEAVKNKNGETVLISQTGTALANVGKLTIDVSEHKVTSELIAAKDVTVPANEKVAEKVAEISAKVKENTSSVIGKSEVLLTTKDADGNRIVRKQETNIGNLCADAYRAIMGTDVALIQGGGVRADIAAGDITYGNVLSVNPWNNFLCVKKVSGQTLLDALEHGARSTPTSENGGFFQVSGMTYDINTSVESTVKTDDQNMFVSVEGARRVQNVKVNGKAIDPKAYYTVASTEYVLKNSGDGMTMFKDAEEVPASTVTDVDAVVQYIKENLNGVVGSQYAAPEGRINLVDTAPTDEKKAISSVSLSKKTFVYNTKEQIPTVTVKDEDGKVLVAGTDYTITYPAASTLVGTYSVKVDGTGDYDFSKTLSYVINPMPTSITKVAAGTKSFRVTWKKVKKQITGYQIRYATKSSMKGSKTVTVNGYKTTSKQITKLAAKKKYYVQVRVYRTVSGKKYYSTWSAKKSVKTK